MSTYVQLAFPFLNSIYPNQILLTQTLTMSRLSFIPHNDCWLSQAASYLYPDLRIWLKGDQFPKN